VSVLTGKLGADFTSFYDAVQKAEVSLRSFESGSEKVGAALTKMANSFSGQKIIQDATLMVKAIDNAGGAATLTAKEMARVNTTVTEAIAKYTALGQQAPKAMTDLASATKGTDAATSSFMGSLSKMNGLLATFGIGLSIGAVVSFGKSLLNMGDEIVRVADRTGLTIDEVQKLSYVAQQSGNSIDELTGAIGQMQNRLSSGDKSAVASVKELGINFQALMASSPATQLEMIATAIAKVPDPADRTRIAMDLFGKSGTAILPTLTAQFAKLALEAPKMSDATVKALDKAGDQLGRFGLQIKVWAAESYNFVGRGFDQIVASAYRGVAGLIDATAAVVKLASYLPGAAGALGKLGVEMGGLTQKAGWFRDAAALLVAPIEETTTAAKMLAPAMKDAGEHTEKTAGSVRKVKEEVERLLPGQNTWALGIGQLSQRIPVLTDHINAQAEAFAELRTWVAPLAVTDLPALNKQIMLLPNVTASGATSITTAANATSHWSSTLTTLSNDFVQMAQIGGDSFATLGRVIGTVIKSFEMMTKGAEDFGKASKSAAGASTQDYTALAMTGVGAGVAIGAMVAQYRNAQRELRKLAIEQAILNGLQEKWNTDVQLTTNVMYGQRTEFSQTSAIVKELGGVAKLTAEEYKHLAEELTHAIAALGMADDDWMNTESAKDALDLLNDSLADMGRVAMKSGGLVDRTFLELIKTMKEFGVEVEGVNDLLLEQLGGAAEGLNELLGGLSKGLGDSFTVTAEQAAGLGAAAAATFADMVERGMSFKEALDALKPSIDIMAETLKKSGMDGGDAFDFLIEMSRIASDQFMGPLSDAITGANKALKGLHNSGILNQTMFTGLEQSALQAYNEIIKGGGDGNAALMMLQPTLQTLWSLQKDFGYEVDAATQALIDEAVATGKVGDKHRPIAEQMLLATQAIEKAVTALAKAMGADLPESAEKGAKGVQAAFDKVKVDAPWKDWGPPPTAGGPAVTGVDFAASGGMVTDRGIQHFAAGGSVLKFMPRGSDTVPAMLTPGEMVLTPAQQRRLLNGGGDNTAILAEFRQMRADQARRDARLNEAVAKAVKNEVQKVGGRRR